MLTELYKEEGKKLDSSVTFRLLDKEGKIIQKHRNYQCFSPITYSTLPPEIDKIVVRRSIFKIPYDYPTIERWIVLLNQLGFPCSVSRGCFGCMVKFTINTGDYKHKAHLASTLQLIRCLFEIFICYVPEFYFRLEKNNPDADKFTLLQDAHREVHSHDEGKMANTNHMCTYKGNEYNTTRKELFEGFEKSGNGVFGSNNFGYAIYRLWRTKPCPQNEAIYI